MQRPIIALLCAAGALILISQVSPQAIAGDPAGGPVQWKGTTKATLMTDAGHAAMNAACTSEYPGTRICLESEVYGSVPGPLPGRDGYVISQSSGGGALGNSFIMLSATGFGQVNNCAEDGGVYKTKKVGRTMVLEGSGNVAIKSCKSVYGEGGLGVACCGR